MTNSGSSIDSELSQRDPRGPAGDSDYFAVTDPETTKRQGAKLLIVDDLPANLQALEKVIKRGDRTIYQATSGEAALGLLLEHEFALAIIDVMMPGMNGFELAELMRGAEKTRHIPIVFVSAAGRELNYAFQGYESGAVDFLYKPLDTAAVKSKVNVFVSLYQQRQELNRQVATLEKTRRDLDVARAELQRALDMRDDFISMVTHELRSPLNSLHLEAQVRRMLLDKGQMEAFSANQLEAMLDRDGRQIQSMTRLISDMVDVSRLHGGKLSIKTSEINLPQLLARVVDDLSTQAKAVGSEILLDAHGDAQGSWDEFRLEQILINLLTNAMRYGAGKPIEVSFRVNQQEVEVSVRDHGVGIAASEQQRIFDKFERVGNKEVREGLGMGLYIARQLSEAQGGTLDVHSVLGEGATFRLALPL